MYVCQTLRVTRTDQWRVRRSVWRHFLLRWRPHTSSGRSRRGWSTGWPVCARRGRLLETAPRPSPTTRWCTTWPSGLDFRSRRDTWESSGDRRRQRRRRRRWQHPVWLQTPGPRLPSRPHSFTALWLVLNYAAWWQRDVGVKDLPRIAARKNCQHFAEKKKQK